MRAGDRGALRAGDGRRAGGVDAGPAGAARGARRRQPEPAVRAGGEREEPTGPQLDARSRPGTATSTPTGDAVVLERRFREPKLRFWKCANERAQAQATAREVEHLLAGGAAADAICVLLADPAREGGAVAAAMEERGIPFHLAGPTALFQRAEVRDAIAWLRVLADPDDSAAAARALTRPPVELRPGDLARLTTIARRRKLDMVAGCEAALDSPQFQPEARERIQTFLKLYGTAAAVMEERRADVFVRRLIEAVGLRRQRLFAAQPEVAERLLGLSRLAELATAWTRREPHGSTRGFVAYLTAVAEAGVEPAGGEEPPAPGAVVGLALDAVKGLGFDHVFALGLEAEAEWGGSAGRRATELVLSRRRRRRGGAPRRAPTRRRSPRPRTRSRRSTRRSSSAPPRASTRPTGRCASRCSRRAGGRAASSRSRASTPRSTSTGRSPATSSC